MQRVVVRTVSRRSAQRGVTLLESVVGFLVLAAASAAIGQLHSHLQLAADIARQRTEAIRLGEEALEQLRAFTSVDAASGPTYGAIANGSVAVDAASAAAHSGYRVERSVDADAFAATKATSVTVRWPDRDGGAHAVALHAFIAAHDPLYAGALALDVGAIPAAARGVAGRAPGVPITARSIGGGRSAWKPIERGNSVWLFDDRSGDVVAVCDGVAPTIATRAFDDQAVRDCAAGRWRFFAGTVRAAAGAPTAIAALSPSSLALAVERRDAGELLRPACVAEARKTVRFEVDGALGIADVPLAATAPAGGPAWQESGDRFIAWRCIVPATDAGRLPVGRFVVVPIGWSIGTAASEGRVCRIQARDGDRDAIDANIATAVAERTGDTRLAAASFTVVRGSDPCPPDPASEQQP